MNLSSQHVSSDLLLAKDTLRRVWHGRRVVVIHFHYDTLRRLATIPTAAISWAAVPGQTIMIPASQVHLVGYKLILGRTDALVGTLFLACRCCCHRIKDFRQRVAVAFATVRRRRKLYNQDNTVLSQPKCGPVARIALDEGDKIIRRKVSVLQTHQKLSSPLHFYIEMIIKFVPAMMRGRFGAQAVLRLVAPVDTFINCNVILY